MKRILKYPLKNVDDQFVVLPHNSIPLSVGVQNCNIMLWALVDSNEKYTDARHIKIAGTGHDLPDTIQKEYDFLGTVFQDPFVWHIWVKK